MTLDSGTLALLEQVIEQDEGGWKLTSNSNDPDGGWTYAGVTRTTFEAWMRTHYTPEWSATADDMSRSMAGADVPLQNEVREIYQSEFIVPSSFARVPAVLQRGYLSAVINLGVVGGVKVLQTALGLQADGIIGLKTLGALQQAWSAIEGINCSDPAAYASQLLIRFRIAWQRHYIAIACASADLHASGEAPLGEVEAWRDLDGWYLRAERATAVENEQKGT